MGSPQGKVQTVALRLLRWLIPENNPDGAVFGLITIGVLLAAESTRRETYLEVVGSALIALLLYWLAHAYSIVLGSRLRRGARLSGAVLWDGLVEGWALVRGAALPLLAVPVAALAGASSEEAATAALVVCAASLLFLELAAGVLCSARPAELLLDGVIGATMGIGVLALRVVLH